MNSTNPNPNENASSPGLSRRTALSLIGGATAAVSLVGIGGKAVFEKVGLSLSETTGQPLVPPPCVVKPQQTEGPYFVDEQLKRFDIRADPSDGSVKEGVPLHLNFQVSQLQGDTCTPLPNAIVDIWHCDARGVYSGVQDRSFDTRGKSFLRGYQLTDANGMAQFLTIFPGWYQGRATHIHFKIRTDASEEAYEFTSQIYFDDTLNEQIHNQPPYAAQGRSTLKNDRDSIFRRGGEELLLALTQEEDGYAGTFEIGLQLS